MVNLFRYCLCWFLLASPLAFAADRVIVVEPSQLQKTYTPGSGAYAFNDSRSWSEPVSVQNGRVNLPVVADRKFTWASFRNGLKNALKVNPASIALNATVAGALAAVGWVLDPANNSIQRPASEPEPAPNSIYYSNASSTLVGCTITATSSSPQAFANLWKDCLTTARGMYGPVTITAVNIGSFSSGTSNSYEVQAIITYWPSSSASVASSTARYAHMNGTCSAPLEFNPATGICFDPALSNSAPPTDAEWDSFGDSFSNPADAAAIAPDVISAVPGSYDYPDGFDFSGPESLQGEPVTTTTTTPTSTTVSESTPTYNFDYSSNPNTITTTTTTTTNVYQDGNLILTENTTNAGTINPVQPAPELEIPTDCEFMPTVCAWLDWFKTPAPMPEPDMPQVVDDEFRQEYTVSFGGSCPAPRTVESQFGTLSLSWQPLCDLAAIIRYLVIASASLYAAFIGLGISRGSR